MVSVKIPPAVGVDEAIVVLCRPVGCPITEVLSRRFKIGAGENWTLSTQSLPRERRVNAKQARLQRQLPTGQRCNNEVSKLNDI